MGASSAMAPPPVFRPATQTRPLPFHGKAKNDLLALKYFLKIRYPKRKKKKKKRKKEN